MLVPSYHYTPYSMRGMMNWSLWKVMHSGIILKSGESSLSETESKKIYGFVIYCIEL
jgi:hypothetical protein